MTTAISYRLLLVQPNVVFEARVNQASVTGDAAQVTFDTVTTGTHSDIKINMMVLFGTSAGADDLGRAHVRREPTADTIYFGWASRGAGEGEVTIQDNAYITVIDLYKPWTRNPRIDENGEQFIDYDGQFFTYMHQPPIVNLDCPLAVQRDLDPDTGLATFEFNAIHTYMTDPDAAAMYSAFSWNYPIGAQGVINDPAHYLKFSAPEGAYWVTAYEMSDQGGVGFRHVLCVAGEPVGTLTKFDQLELVRRLEGQTLRARISEPVPEGVYPNGCVAVLWKRQTENGVAVTPSGLTGHENICFVGWHYTDEINGRATERGYIDDTYLEFRDLGGWLQVLPGYPIIINRDQTPTSWVQQKRANIDYATSRLVLMYSNAASLGDFIWSGLGYDYYPFPSLTSQGTTLYEMVDYFARAIAHRLTCDQWGRLHIKPDPQLCDDLGGSTPTARTASVQKALTEADWSALRITATPFPRQNWNWEEGIVAKSVDADAELALDTVYCVAPGRAPSQGTTTAQTGEQLVTGQAELNARAGHRYAAHMNNPTGGVEIALAGIDDFAIQPAYMTWITFTTSAATAGQRGRVYNAQRLLPAEVTVTHDAERLTQTVTIRAEREVYGTPAATYYPPSTDFGDLPDWTPPEPVTPPTSDWGLSANVNKLFLVHASGEVSVTSTFTRTSSAGGPTYTVVDLSLDGTVLDAVTDAYSPLYLGTGTTVNVWIVTTTRIYYVEDVAGVSSRSVTSQHTFTVASDYRTIQTERGVKNWALVSSYYTGQGVRVARTTDGSTWTEVTVTTGTLSLDAPQILAGSGSTTLFVEPPTMWLDTPSATGIYEEWAYYGYGFSARTGYDVIGAWFTIANYSGLPKIIKRMRGISTGMPVGYTDLWDNTSDELGNGNYVAIAQWADYSASQVKDYINASYTALINPEKDPVAAGNAIWAGLQEGFPPSTFTWDMTVRLIGYGTPSAGAGGTGIVTPTLHVSGKTPGLAYTGAVSGSAGRLYKSTDYGATWALTNLPASDFGQSLGGAFHFPWHNNASELLYYWGKYVSGVYSSHRTEANGVTRTNITPFAGFGLAGPKAWSTSATNRNVLALTAHNGTNTRGYLSQDGGGTWSYVVPEAVRASGYIGVHVADDTAVLYLWGGAGVAYSGSGGLLIDDRTGNASGSDVIAIGGW